MEYKKLSVDTQLPVLGLGTWQMGGRTEPDYSNDELYVAAIKNAIALGYTLIDTAESYGDGHAEELICKAIDGIDRKKLFIISKVSKWNLSYDAVIKSANASLKRLGIDYFDLYLIHFSSSTEVPIEETMKAMDYLVDNKITRFIGVSNFSVDEMKAAQAASKNRIVANQIQYSLMTRNESTYCSCINMESEIIPYCQENDMLIIADRPLHKGILLSGKYPILDSLSKKYSKTSAQVALNWLITKKNVITIPMSTKKEHLAENLGAVGWHLSDDDMALLDETKFEE